MDKLDSLAKKMFGEFGFDTCSSDEKKQILKAVEESNIKAINEQKEQMQQDALSILDGIDDQVILDQLCQMIVDRMNIVIAKIK